MFPYHAAARFLFDELINPVESVRLHPDAFKLQRFNTYLKPRAVSAAFQMCRLRAHTQDESE